MTIMGINFTKIVAEKKKGTKEKVNISNNVAITSVEKLNLNFTGSEQQALKFGFSFTSKFEPDVGIINLDGELVYLAQKKNADDIVAGWEKNKRLDSQIMSLVMNNVLNKCNIEAILMSKEMNLPSPVPMPRVNIETKAAEPAKEEKPKTQDKKAKK